MKYFSTILFLFFYGQAIEAQNFIQGNHNYKVLKDCGDTSKLYYTEIYHTPYLYPKPNAFEPGNYFVSSCYSSYPIMFFTVGKDKNFKNYFIWFNLNRRKKIKGYCIQFIDENGKYKYGVFDAHDFPFGQIKFLKKVKKMYRQAE